MYTIFFLFKFLNWIIVENDYFTRVVCARMCGEMLPIKWKTHSINRIQFGTQIAEWNQSDGIIELMISSKDFKI